MNKAEYLAEKCICNGKCHDDITKNYVHCRTCTRLKDFLAGYKTGFENCAKASRLKKQKLTKAMEIIMDYIKLRDGIFTNEDDFNMAQESLDKKAEAFLKNEG